MQPIAFGQLLDKRRNNFDFLRFVFAAAVIASHAKVGGLVPAAGEEHALRILGMGRMAVNGFFIISGFLIARSWLASQGLGDYLKKRALRIYPALIVYLLLTLLVFAPLGGAHLGALLANPHTLTFFRPLILQDNQTLPGAFLHTPFKNQVVGPVWTIRYEIFCYLALAGFGLAGLLGRPKVVLGAFLGTLAVFTVQSFAHPAWELVVPYFGQIGSIFRLTCFFLAGMTFYLYRDKIPYSPGLLILSLLILGISYKFIPSVTLPIFGTYVLFWVAFSPSIRLYDFAKRGDYSYGMYLYAWPAEQIILEHYGRYFVGDHLWQRGLLFLLVFSITYVLAALSWHLLEKPCLKLKRSSRPVPLPESLPAEIVVSQPATVMTAKE